MTKSSKKFENSQIVEAQNMWNSFIKLSKISIAGIAGVLILMLIFLV
jgi:hypothetical protein